MVEFTPTQLTTTLRVVDDVTHRDTRIETLARFTVQAGRPVVEPLESEAATACFKSPYWLDKKRLRAYCRHHCKLRGAWQFH